MYLLNPNLKDFWQWRLGPDGKLCYKYARNRVLYGGRASSKTHEFGGAAAKLASEHRLKFLCVRRFQNKIKESVYTVIKDKISAFELGGFSVLSNEIHNQNGSSFVFYGIERNIDEIKSFEGADVLWIEEAHNLTADQWQILEPTIRSENSEIWISFNPHLMTDFVYERFIISPPPNTISRLINYTDNPHLSVTARLSAETMQKEDPELYENIYLGVPLKSDEMAIIKGAWLDAAIDADMKLGLDLSGKSVVGYDVADSGADRNCAVSFLGSKCVDLDVWKAGEDEITKSSIRAHDRLGAKGLLIYDSIGVGASVGAILKQNGRKGYVKFNSAAKPFNPDKEYAPKITNAEKFENLKAQAWRSVADRLRNTYNAVTKGFEYAPEELISISSNLPHLRELKAELTAPHSARSKSSGKDKVEAKEDVRKRIGKSTDLADPFVMGACPHLVKSKPTRLEIYG